MNQEGVDSPTRLSASASFADECAAQVNQMDVELIIQSQKQMMSRFEKTNEMLINCNALSTMRCHVASQEFKRHTQLLIEMKKDLDSIFKRVRVLKTKLSSQHADAFKAVASDSDVILNEQLPESSETTSVEIPSITVVTQDEKQDSSSCSNSQSTPSPNSSSSADTT